MEQKPAFIWILIILWIVISILFLGSLITYTFYYFDQFSNSGGNYFDNKWSTMSTFSFILYFGLFLFMFVFSVLLTFGTIMKKSWSWILGLMISSFSGFFLYLGIQTLGSSIIMDNFDQIFSTPYSSFQYTTFIMMIFFVPIILIILTRSQVKNYFNKDKKTDSINLTYPINRN